MILINNSSAALDDVLLSSLRAPGHAQPASSQKSSDGSEKKRIERLRPHQVSSQPQPGRSPRRPTEDPGRQQQRHRRPEHWGKEPEGLPDKAHLHGSRAVTTLPRTGLSISRILVVP